MATVLERANTTAGIFPSLLPCAVLLWRANPSAFHFFLYDVLVKIQDTVRFEQHSPT